MIVLLKSYVTVAKTIEVKYRDVLCIGSTLTNEIIEKSVTHTYTLMFIELLRN